MLMKTKETKAHCTASGEGFMTANDLEAAAASIAPRVTVRQIAAEVCGHTGTSVVAVMGRSRAPHTCRVRELVCFIAHRRGISLAQIARVLRRDHSTIKHAIENELRRRAEEGR